MAANLLIKGESGHLIVPITAIPVITAGAFGYFRDSLPEFCLENASMVIGLAGAFTLALMLVASFLRSRRVEIRGDRLYYESWFTRRTLQLGEITAVSFETEIGAGTDTVDVERFLSLWRGDELLLRFNARLWPRAGLRSLLVYLRQWAPEVRFDRGVEAYVARA